MNQSKLEMVKQETARVNIDFLGIRELKWTGLGKFHSDDHYIYYCGQESLRRNGVTLIVNKRVKHRTWVQSQKCQIDLIHCQGTQFSITVIKIYAPTRNAEKAEVEWFSEDLKNLLELTPKKKMCFSSGDWNAKVGNQEIPGVTDKLGLGIQN